MTAPNAAPVLHVIALNGSVDLTTSFLSRHTEGDIPDLRPLARQLSLSQIELAGIEVFAIADLGGLTLSDYIAAGYAPADPISDQTRATLDAIKGSVALLPSSALPQDETPQAMPPVELIATLPLARADHEAMLPKADLAPTPAHQTQQGPPPSTSRRWVGLVTGLSVLLILVIAILIGVGQ